MTTIMAVGDTHGDWSHLNQLINKKHPDIILQCGDWGWWPKFHNTTMVFNGYETVELTTNDGRKIRHRIAKKWDLFAIKPQKTKIYWCDGNHEDHWDLKEERNYIPSPCETQKNVYYMKRGSVLTLPDGKNIMFFGGATSIDKEYRKIGLDWFPEETIADSDIRNLPNSKIDIMVTHTCPLEVNKFLNNKTNVWAAEKLRDPSQDALSYLLNRYNPELWFFGHFHTTLKTKISNTTFYAMNMPPNEMWWRWVPGYSPKDQLQ